MISRSGEVPVAFSTQVSLGVKTLCCGVLEDVFAILLQKHLQVSSLARAKYCTSRAKYFTTSTQHSHGVAPLGALHLEYGIGEISWSLAAWEYFPLLSLLWEAHFPLLPPLFSKYCPSGGSPQLGTFHSFASTLSVKTEKQKKVTDLQVTSIVLAMNQKKCVKAELKAYSKTYLNSLQFNLLDITIINGKQFISVVHK